MFINYLKDKQRLISNLKIFLKLFTIKKESISVNDKLKTIRSNLYSFFCKKAQLAKWQLIVTNSKRFQKCWAGTLNGDAINNIRTNNVLRLNFFKKNEKWARTRVNIFLYKRRGPVECK